MFASIGPAIMGRPIQSSASTITVPSLGTIEAGARSSRERGVEVNVDVVAASGVWFLKGTPRAVQMGWHVMRRSQNHTVRSSVWFHDGWVGVRYTDPYRVRMVVSGKGTVTVGFPDVGI